MQPISIPFVRSGAVGLEGAPAPAIGPEPRNIVDRLIFERAPNLARSRFGRHLLERWLRKRLFYDQAVDLAEEIAPMDGLAIMDRVMTLLDLRLEVRGLERLPEDGLVFVAANHPTGIADGVAVHQAIAKKRKDIVTFCNRDALRVAPGLSDVLIPVEWRAGERTGERRRETLRAASAAARARKCVVLFPSGRLARMSWRGLAERPWQPTLAALARKHRAPIVPLHVSCRNSALFYLFAQLNDELRDITLFRETLNKKARPFLLEFGKPISPDALPADPAAATQRVQRHVESRFATPI